MITTSTQDSSLAKRLRRETTAEVLFDEFSRGLYSTDASIYQIKPLGVVVPKTEEDVLATISIANDTGVSVTMRGGGTSQCGQTVGDGIIVDVSKHLNRLISVDPERDTPEVLASYVKAPRFPKNLVGLTGTPEEIRAAADEFLSDFSRVEQSESQSEYTMDHTSLLYLMDENWQLKTFFTHEDTAETISACLGEILQD